ncbi:MAG: hypothetical protein EOL95_07090 [Bacteroidia bacterium]|nr:hypothetical protein [Bacteroidia bacterium]
MVRFYGKGTNGKPSVIAYLKPYGKEQANKLRKILEQHFNLIELNYPNQNNLEWAHMNYIQTNKAILLPGIGNNSDNMAEQSILYHYNEEKFPEYKQRISTIQMRNFIKNCGGGLNCLSWTVLIPNK